MWCGVRRHGSGLVGLRRSGTGPLGQTRGPQGWTGDGVVDFTSDLLTWCGELVTPLIFSMGQDLRSAVMKEGVEVGLLSM